MELLVVGLGSMGKRRARLIRGVEPSAALAGVDFAPARREEARALGIEPYESIAAAVAARRFDAGESSPVSDSECVPRPLPTRASSASCWTRAYLYSPS